MVNAWRLMKYVTKDKIPFLDFVRSTVMETLKLHGTDRLRPGPALVLRGHSKEPVRRDGKDHWIVSTDGSQPVCKVCAGRSSWKCEKCNIGLHPKCFKIYHTLP